MIISNILDLMVGMVTCHHIPGLPATCTATCTCMYICTLHVAAGLWHFLFIFVQKKVKKPGKGKEEEEEEQSSEESESEEDDDTSELGSIPDPVASSKYQVHCTVCGLCWVYVTGLDTLL